eukprot:NODE_8266_length_694_cov_41.014011_g7644_i0.p1 GENE.NODE_8266_length_694_cov_41.014011_g7644_i0~~NODE_8266_length_694_cov_41.014011_g7644_i0.p1  ORF type:complete len:229 (+),score=48.73 NODE_8266_length_694_cov_41.014011_g7644_i0:84-689(+)
MTYTQFDRGLAYQMEGLSIFSKYPIIHDDYVLLSRNGRDSADEHQRGCLGVSVLTPHMGIVNVFSSHYTLSQQQQLFNALETVNFMDQFTKTSQSIVQDNSPAIKILMGDLNSTPDSDAIRYLTGQVLFRGKYGPFRDIYNTSDYITFNAMGNERKRIDFILLDAPTNVVSTRVQVVGHKRIQGTASSDHWPVFADLQYAS